ncbi:MAG: glycosyltransferase family 4 protein [Gloeomargarita sp. SKYBB_i_bin120]|nr:glycosyltransferase family 4 protein [Gloeomargarita sp. SKYB120]MDW8178516.1 glycosyltransferase family 4 protein [Gloeomargarita sp. SKYBB_i_bin120]
MRIVFVVTRGDAIGGAQIHVKDLAIHLRKIGHTVTVISGAGEPFQQLLAQHAIPHHVLPELVRPLHPWKDVQAYWILQQLLGKLQPDVVSIHSSKAGILARLVCYQRRIPFVFTVHGWSFGMPSRLAFFYRWLERRFAAITPKIICVAEAIRKQGIAIGIAPEKLVTIYNAMPDIHPELRAQPGQGPPVRIMTVGRLEPQKAHADLLQAVAQLANPEVRVDIVGDGPLREDLQQLASALGLQEQVTFWGYRPDVARLLAQAHIFALISHWEAFPRSTLEAMRAGLPVVVSDVGGAAEAVVPGVTGYVIPPGDQEQLVQCLQRLVQDPIHRQQLGNAGRQRYEALFTFERLLQETLTVYAQVTGLSP